MTAAAQEEERQQQALMRSLRAFVDALRDIPRDAAPTADVQRAVRALCQAPDAGWSEQQCRENVWRTGLVPMLQRLCVCMERLDRFEVRSSVRTAHWWSLRRLTRRVGCGGGNNSSSSSRSARVSGEVKTSPRRPLAC